MIRGSSRRDSVRVLIVDDNRDFAENLGALSELRGLTPTLARDCASARAAVRDETFDVAIVDQKLPDGRGTELLAELRQRFPELVTLVVTAFVSLDNSLAALREGAFAFVGKDSDPEELLETIARAAENAKLRRENRALRDLHDATLLAIPDFLLLVDESGRVVSVNRRHHALCPRPPQEALGRPLDEVIGAGVREQGSLAQWAVDVRAGAGPVERTLELADAEGRKHILGLHAVALAPPSEPLVLLRAVDLTERISLERRLSDSEHLATLGRLVSSIAHDLRNPLAGIRALSQILRRSVARAPHDAENVDEIIALADRMSATLADLLDFARPGPRRDEPLQLAELLGSLVVAAQRWPAAEGRRIEVDFARRPALVRGARDHVESLFANLIDNALQAAPPGGRVRVTLAAEADHAEVAVEDDGPGVSPEIAARLFQPFVTSKTRGTGLGLSIARKHAEALGGAIEFDRSWELGGACFRVRLPLYRNSSA